MEKISLFALFIYFKGSIAIRTQALYRMNTNTRSYEIWIPKIYSA